MYLMALVAMFTACSEPMEEITEVNYPSAFSPINLRVDLGTFDKATVTWKSFDDVRLYVVQLSQGDSLQFNNIIKEYETEATSLALTELIGETRYSVRVRALAFNADQEDSKWSALTFRTNAEQLFYNVANDDIKTGQITVRWTPNSTVTHLTVNPEIGNIALSGEEITAGVKTLTGLAPVTTYTISIYNGEQRRGSVIAVTKWRPSGDDVVELSQGDDFVAAVTDPANEGKIIYLAAGNYDWASNANFVRNITVYGDPDGERPVLEISVTEPLKLNQVTADYIHFENVALVANRDDGYFINQGTSATDHICSIGRLSFENCRINGLGRSLVRTQVAGERFDTIRINNCLIENSSRQAGQNYALIQCTVAFEAFPEIFLTNTTVNHSYSNFLSLGGGAGQPSGKNLTIENCTFYKTVGSNSETPDNRFFVDGGTNGPLNITVRNCILGSVRGVGSECGIRTHADSRVTATGNYRTSDWVLTSGVANTSDVPATAYAGDCNALFVDPENGNFHFKDSSFAGRSAAGDPRWW